MPLELPTGRELELAEEGLQTLRTAYSPVFFSTAPDGSVHRGLGHLQLEPGKPVLLVGNHQVVPLDVGFIVAQVGTLHPRMYQ